MAKLLKKLNKSENHTAFSLFTSIFSIFLCIACFAGSTLAWLTADQSSETHTFESANTYVDSLSVEQEIIVYYPETVTNDEGESYEIMVPSVERASRPFETSFGVSSFTAAAGGKYIITYSVGGTANRKLLVVEANGRRYYTTSKSGTFNVTVPSESVVRIYASWGKKISQATKFITGETIGGALLVAEPLIENEYTEEEKDTEAETEAEASVPEQELPAEELPADEPLIEEDNTAADEEVL